MQLALTPMTLPALDALSCDLLVVGSFLEDRPLRGTAGLLDWRLNGWISGLVVRDRFSGKYGELLLFPAGHRVGPARVVLLGLGPQAEFDEARLGEAIQLAFSVISRMRSKEAALSLPCSPAVSLPIPRRRLLPLLGSGVRRQAEGGELPDLKRLSVIAAVEDLKAMQAVLETERGRTFPPEATASPWR